MSTLETALKLANKGFSVFPVNRDKTPATPHGLKDATKNTHQITNWFINDVYNLAIATGAPSNNLVVIDLDSHGSTLAFDTLKEWEQLHAPLKPTLTIKTGGGGRHYYYLFSDDVEIKNTTNNAINIDIRGNGGYVVAPPSIHSTGSKYEYENLLDVAVADNNVWNFIDFVKNYRPSKNKQLQTLDAQINEGGRNDGLFRYACKLQDEGLSDNEILLQVKKANSEHCTPPLEDKEILKIVESATINYSKGDKFTHKATQSNISPKVSKTQQRVNELKNMDAETRLRACKVYSIDEALSNFNNIEKLPSTIPTGFNNLDDKLYGGLLCGGLNIIGAVSSLGKTSFCLQMARNIAREHIPVLFVSIEQGVTELTSKLTTLTIMENNLEAQYSYTELMIKEFRKLRKDNEKYIKTLKKSTQILNNEIQNYLYLQQGVNRPTVAEIEVLVDTITETHNRPPVVFIDYLQLLAQQNERDDEKRTVDKNITSLKQLANRINMPVVVISSLNRENYSGEMKTSAFKESGGIEYGADLLLGLQPWGIPNVKKTMKKMKEKDNAIQARIAEMYVDAKYNDGEPIELDLVILKNRNGIPVRDGISYIFDKRHSYFKEWIPPINDNEEELEDIQFF